MSRLGPDVALRETYHGVHITVERWRAQGPGPWETHYAAHVPVPGHGYLAARFATAEEAMAAGMARVDAWAEEQTQPPDAYAPEAEALPATWDAHELGRRIAGALKDARTAERACYAAADAWLARPTEATRRTLRLAEDARTDAWAEVWRLVGEAP